MLPRISLDNLDGRSGKGGKVVGRLRNAGGPGKVGDINYLIFYAI
jgi:hypothetical protein